MDSLDIHVGREVCEYLAPEEGDSHTDYRVEEAVGVSLLVGEHFDQDVHYSLFEYDRSEEARSLVADET